MREIALLRASETLPAGLPLRTNLSSAWVHGARLSSLLLSTPAGRFTRPLRPLGRDNGLKRGPCDLWPSMDAVLCAKAGDCRGD
jgi:hypothetical protein